MKILNLLEARRHAEYFERTRVNHDIDAFWGHSQDLPKVAGTANGFCSFTELNKLGVNPKTVYPHTPNAIYAYPIDYVSEHTSPRGRTKSRKDGVHPAYSQIPFGGGRPFIQCITVNPNATILNLSDSEQCLALLNKFKSQFSGEFTDAFKKRIPKIESSADEMEVKDELERDCRAGKKLWWLIQVFSNGNPNKWTSIFRRLDVDGAVDHGASIIHPNEPVQAVFFHIRCFKIHDVINNKKTSTAQPSGEQQPGHAEYLQFIKVIENKVILAAFASHFEDWYSYQSEVGNDVQDLATQVITDKCKGMIAERYPMLDVKITINRLIELCERMSESIFSNLKMTIKYEEVEKRSDLIKKHLPHFRKYLINGIGGKFEGLIDILTEYSDDEEVED